MLSQSLRPLNFSEVAGQVENIRILKAIIRNPDKAPKSLIFAGAYGSGKTTCARIMARELNKIKDADYDILNSPFYFEFDSTVVGNVEEIRQLRDTFSLSYGDYWRVIVFDESHSVSQQAQTALLKVLEEVKGKNIFILATTHVQKMLPTIRSRSLELTFETVPVADILLNLDQVAASRGLDIPQDIRSIIAQRSNGHMRNAHMLLDKFLLLGEEDFRDSVKSSLALYCAYFTAVYLGDKDGVLESLNELLNIPKDDLQQDFHIFLTESMRASCGLPVVYDLVAEVVRLYGSDFNLLVSCYMAPWFLTAFTDMPYFQAAMLSVYTQVTGGLQKRQMEQKQPGVAGGRFGNRAVR